MAFEPNWATPEELIKDYLANKGYAQNLLGGAPAEPEPAQVDPWKQVQEAIKAVQPAQPTQPAPEKEFSATEEINKGTIAQAAPDSDVAKAVRNGQQLQPPQGEFRYPNPTENRFLQGVMLNKALYENLPPDEQYNALREEYHKNAEALREQAATAGIDVSRWGADNSTARDMNQQVQSDRARALLESTMPDGKYYRTADQYYHDSYYDHIALGYSPRQARKFAANRAREYQADRVGYLDATYNSYGRDGYLTTPEGVKLLAEIAKENPALANYYSQVYPLPKDEYNRLSKLDESAIQQGYRMEQLGFGAQSDLQKIAMQIYGNVIGQNNAWGIEQQRMKLNDHYKKSYRFFDSSVGLQEYAKKAGIDDKYLALSQKRLAELKESGSNDALKWYDTAYTVGKLNGKSDEEAAEIAAQYAFQKLVNDAQPKSQSGTKSEEPKLTAAQQEKVNRADNLVRVAKNSHSDEDIQALETFLNGDGGEDKGSGMDFSPANYQMYSDILLALKGYQCKLRNDDNGATAYWAQVKDVNVLKKMYPKENFDYYWERRGGKPQ